MGMNVNKTWDGDVLTFAISGRLDTNTAPDFIDVVKAEAADASRVVFDLQDLVYISSAGIRVIVSTAKMMAAKDGIAVKNLCPEVYEVFDLVGLTGLIDIE